MQERKTLIRKEVIAAFQSRHLGPAQAARALSNPLLTGLTILFLGVLCFFVYAGQIKDTRNARGVLGPEQGLAVVYPPGGGVYAQILVAEGSPVRKGDLLATIVNEKFDESGNEINLKSIQQLEAQKRDSLAQLAVEKRRFEIGMDQIDTKIAGLKKTIAASLKESEILERRVEFADDELSRVNSLLSTGAISIFSRNEKMSAALATQQQYSALKTSIQDQENALADFQQQRRLLPVSFHEAEVNLQTRSTQLDSSIDDFRSRRSVSVKARVDGKVAAVTAKVNEAAVPTSPLLSIIPATSTLIARLFVSPSAIGAVQRGQEVDLVYDGFPIETHGSYKGKVVAISNQTIDPRTTLIADPRVDTPVYIVDVEINEQQAGGVPLQSGMLLSATIVVQKQTILQRIFQPMRRFKELKL